MNISNFTNTTNTTNNTTIVPSSNYLDYTGFIFTISCSIVFILILVCSCLCEQKKCKSKCCTKTYYTNEYIYDVNSDSDNDSYKTLTYGSSPPHVGVVTAKVMTEDV